MSNPQFKIHGNERRILKKQLNELKNYVKYFWFYHQLDKDVTNFYGGKDDYPVSDEESQKMIDVEKLKIKIIEERLSEKL